MFGKQAMRPATVARHLDFSALHLYDKLSAQELQSLSLVTLLRRRENGLPFGRLAFPRPHRIVTLESFPRRRQ
jgi:hypothetical protein